jgi:GNAT superfamily N-acetyltransferase
MEYTIRNAVAQDAAMILAFIRELASYEKLADSVVATVADVEKTLFCETPRAEALILEEGGEPAGFALYFHNYSTFLGRYGIYIEDIYVREAFRGRGYGKALLKRICEEAMKRDCGRVEWWCLDWNRPAIDFYLGLGAEPMSDWTVYRLNREQIAEVAKAA